MSDKIKVRRGDLPDLPTLDEGEFGLAQDVGSVYIGSSSGNILVNPVKGDADGYTLDADLSIPSMQQYMSVDRTVDSTSLITTPWSAFGDAYGGTVVVQEIQTGASSNITFDTVSGIATVGQTGVYVINAVLVITMTSGVLDNLNVLVNESISWNAQPSAATGPIERTINIIRTINSGERVAIQIEAPTASLVMKNGSSFNIYRIA